MGDLMKPIIGIIGRPGFNQKTTIEVLDSYRIAIIKSGGIPILILPTQTVEYYNNKNISLLTMQEKDMLKRQIDLVDGILLQGGSVCYEYDKYICSIAQSKPILGICMGMQVMCNYENDNKNIKIDKHQSNDDYVHDVYINKNSYLYKILKEEKIKTNSKHNYKVQNSGSYNICGKSGDVIEAIEKGTGFNIGVQWHPEKNYDNDIYSQRLFREFIYHSKKSYH